MPILKDHKFNYIRLRLFVNAAAAGGYSLRGSEPARAGMLRDGRLQPAWNRL
jgi:hypothetical protein